MLMAVAATAAAAIAVLGFNNRSSGMQTSAASVAIPPALVRRDSVHTASPAEYAPERIRGDAADSLDVSPASLLEDLFNARGRANADERELATVDSLARLVEVDPQAAAGFAEGVAEPHLREVCMRVVAQGWAHVDSVTATSWASSLGDSAERDQAISNVALELAQRDPPRAVQLLERHFIADVPEGVLEGVAQQWAERSYRDARAWSETLPPGARRDRVLQRLVFVRASQNPRDAARLVEETFADSDERADALVSIAISWGSRDLQSAREWARSLEGSVRERVAAELALLPGTQM